MNYKTISAYFTTRNAQQMHYPFIQSIKSVFCFSSEIVICDTSDGIDNTVEELNKLKVEFEKNNGQNTFKIVTNPECNWKANNSGVYDGLNKAYARSHCTGDLCLQLDIDEIITNVNKNWLLKVANKTLTPEEPILAFPVVEPWGSQGKIRCDINPWKERLSLNLINITHGIPGPFRKYEDGLLYAKATDGCNMIDSNTLQPINIKTLSQVLKPIKQPKLSAAPHINESSNKIFQEWFNNLIKQVPFVWHYSWYNIADKIHKYKYFWNDSWQKLYNEKRPPGYNPFFIDKSLDEVTDNEIQELANKLEKECGGHIFHKPWNGEKTLHINLIFGHKIPKLDLQTNHVTLK